MKTTTLKQIALTFMILLLVLAIVPEEVDAREEKVNEGYFDVRVTLRFENGTFLEPNPSFNLPYDGAWVDVGLQVELVQSRGSFVEFVYLKVNGESVLHTTGSIRIHTSVYGPTLKIAAYGEAFVSFTDSYYKDSVDGQLSLTQEEVIPYSFLVLGGFVFVAFVLLLVKKRR
ncbi:MAG: hypothetical protein KAQ65_04105 [Candidatus Thorarchaeota archaeon]|nr:hypothetical protein [Candidatus Thorarchaeota archaeon]MCK5238006.1 hypothetical protein [Candidatus Thorarchaeota archaeon]